MKFILIYSLCATLMLLNAKTLYPHPHGIHSSQATVVISWTNSALSPIWTVINSVQVLRLFFFHISAVGATNSSHSPGAVYLAPMEPACLSFWSFLLVFVCLFLNVFYFLNSMTKCSPWSVNPQAPSAQAGVLAGAWTCREPAWRLADVSVLALKDVLKSLSVKPYSD